MAHERDRNRYEQACCDCGTLVPANEGRLYRLQGAAANGRFRRVPRSRITGIAYTVRCEPCYIQHDKPEEVSTEITSGGSYTRHIEAN